MCNCLLFYRPVLQSSIMNPQKICICKIMNRDNRKLNYILFLKIIKFLKLRIKTWQSKFILFKYEKNKRTPYGYPVRTTLKAVYSWSQKLKVLNVGSFYAGTFHSDRPMSLIPRDCKRTNGPQRLLWFLQSFIRLQVGNLDRLTTCHKTRKYTHLYSILYTYKYIFRLTELHKIIILLG